ncbi:MAG: slipin family protein [Candidatus Omnitrophota bacterium]
MWFYGILVFVIGAISYNFFCKKIIVYDYERGLLYKKGKFIKIVGAGLYRIFKMTTIIKKIDTRIRFITIPGQEVLSSDSISLKISLATQYEIINPELALTRIENYQEAFYVITQIVLREIIGSAPIDEILQKRNEISQRLIELTAQKAETIGIKVISINIKDIMFPGELKKIFAQEVQARKEGLAAIEKARGETAALRNLANAAKMVQDNPALLQLRMLESSGNTFIYGIPNTIVPIKKEGKQE